MMYNTIMRELTAEQIKSLTDSGIINGNTLDLSEYDFSDYFVKFNGIKARRINNNSQISLTEISNNYQKVDNGNILNLSQTANIIFNNSQKASGLINNSNHQAREINNSYHIADYIDIPYQKGKYKD